ncbi:DUF1059 domain-containing protein [Kineococcus sp. NBC_00420]|uniref:DUF1059 domain-containing protein n=1 Tax=unclassified Kineococcus TaxID=2621656 RepID=UPI002E1A8B13
MRTRTGSSRNKEFLVKKFRCGDVVPGCTHAFEGSLDEILVAVSAHARTDHGLVDVPVELVAQVRRAVVDA